MTVQNATSKYGQIFKAEVGKELSASITENFAIGSYLEAWFYCLKLSKEYTQNSRTGFFPSEKAYETYCLFGRVEDLTFIQWWNELGHENFHRGLTSLQIKKVVQHRFNNGYEITLGIYPGTLTNLAGSEFTFIVDQLRKLNNGSGLLSNAPMAWAIYNSRISAESIRLHLDVLEAHENIIRNSPGTKLWCIGEQLHLNPKAMTHRGDTPKEQVEKHIVMGQTVSNFVQKARSLVRNACDGIFPKFTRTSTSTFRTLSKK